MRAENLGPSKETILYIACFFFFLLWTIGSFQIKYLLGDSNNLMQEQQILLN